MRVQKLVLIVNKLVEILPNKVIMFGEFKKTNVLASRPKV